MEMLDRALNQGLRVRFWMPAASPKIMAYALCHGWQVKQMAHLEGPNLRERGKQFTINFGPTAVLAPPAVPAIESGIDALPAGREAIGRGGVIELGPGDVST